MKLLSASLLALSVVAPGAQTAAPPAAAAPAAGMSTYHNDALRLSYTYPANYTDASAMVGPAFEASLSQDPATSGPAKCISLPFSRMQAGTGQVGMLLLVRADAGCLKKKFDAKSVTELAQGEAGGLAASGAKVSFGDPVNFDVASRPAARLEGTFTLPTGQAMQAMIVCVLDRPDVACWQFLANTPQQLHTMSMFPVTFDGGSATALVPSTP